MQTNKHGVPCKNEDIEAALRKSISVFPSISNPSYVELYDFLSESPQRARIVSKKLEEIIECHLVQNAYSYYTGFILSRHCRRSNQDFFKEFSLIDYLETAYARHFPKSTISHVRLLSNVYTEYGQVVKLRDLIRQCEDDVDCRRDERFIQIKMNAKYDVFRDLDGAIATGSKFIDGRKSTEVEKALIRLLIDNKDCAKAKKILTDLAGAVSQKEFYLLEADILEREGAFQDAFDKLSSLPSDIDSEGAIAARKSFCCLSMGRWPQAENICKKFLTLSGFNTKYAHVYLNYEFSRVKQGHKIKEAKIRDIETSTFNKDVKAVALLLLGEKQKSLDVLVRESDTKFSNLTQYLRWPILEQLRPDLAKLHADLASNRRRYGDLKTTYLKLSYLM